MNFLHLLGLLVFSEIAVAVGDILAKRWADGSLPYATVVPVLFCYLLVSATWLFVLKLSGNNLGRASLMWVGTGVAVPVLVGRFMFHETMTATTWLGAIFCTAGMILAAIK